MCSKQATMSDPVSHPAHYAEGWSNGAEVIDITEHLNFNRGNAVKYISRAGKKSALHEVEDLQKAQWYLSREIERLTDRSQAEPSYQVVPDFWAGIDQGIVDAQEKRERETTSRPPRVWESLEEIPHIAGTTVDDSYGTRWRSIRGNWHCYAEDYDGGYWVDIGFANGRSYDHASPFTEVLDIEQSEGFK
jgi:hypothetical protein